jgi:hypothetical protein
MLSYLKFLENEENKAQLKKIVQPLGTMIYNELYVYIWIICVYNVVLLFLLVANLVYVAQLYNISNTLHHLYNMRSSPT